MSDQKPVRVSLVATVLNEYGSLPGWLKGLEEQTTLPDECIIVDGGSDDGTWELLSGWEPAFPVVLERLPGASISEGRNAAIAMASGDIVAVTDAGTVADPEWLQRLSGALAASDDVDVASGFFRPAVDGRWSRTLAAVTLPDAEEIDPDRFQPSSRSVAIRRSWLDLGARYPVWLDYCEDLVLDLQLRRAGAAFRFVPDAVVAFEPRRSWPAFFRQYFRYARGDGKAGLFARRHAIRYAVYGGAAVILARRRPFAIALLAALGTVYLARPARRLWRRTSNEGSTRWAILLDVPLLPLHMAVGDAAKMAGYPVGLIWRARTWGISAIGRAGWWNTRWDGVRWRP